MEGSAPAWRAWQTYQDGSVVEWTGASDAEHPASAMDVVAPAGDAAAAPNPAAAAATAPGAATGAAAPAGGGLVTFAAYGGLVLGALALVAALRKR